MTRSLACIIGACMSCIAGCGGVSNDTYLSEDRKANGLVIILPGIEGESSMNHGIRSGLLASGVNYAVPIYLWGRPVPLAGLLLNQMDVIGNRIEASKIASMVVAYQDSYPGRPVYLIGHSGGGGIAVFVAEAMPAGRQVDGLILLSASLSSGYDLTQALEHTRGGIANFYNEGDVAVLGIGTTFAGNVDGMHGPSAGLTGFSRNGDSDDSAKQQAYARLYQIPMYSSAGDYEDPHSAGTDSGFVSSVVAPWVFSKGWPVAK